jgi:mediator of RNA polymerase II transcription subunit 17, fungi type
MAGNGNSIEDRILQARDTLFEDELFHELSREARIMGSMGVRTHQNLIESEFGKGEEIMFDMVDLDEIFTQVDSDTRSYEYDVTANAVAYCIRILLMYAHRQNLRRRKQTPPPLSPKKRPLPEYLLLQPVAAYLQHNFHVRSLDSFLGEVYQILRSAGLECGYTTGTFSSIKFAPKSDTASTTECLVEGFLAPLESSFSGTIVTAASTFSVKIRTNLSPPSPGTEYEFSINLPDFPHTQPPPRMGLKDDEVEAFIIHLITLNLTSSISTITSQKSRAPSDGSSLTAPRPSRKLLEWEAPFAHYGELLAVSRISGRTKKLSISLSRDELTIQAKWKSAYSEPSKPTTGRRPEPQPLSYTWKSTDESGKKLKLSDVVLEASKDSR